MPASYCQRSDRPKPSSRVVQQRVLPNKTAQRLKAGQRHMCGDHRENRKEVPEASKSPQQTELDSQVFCQGVLDAKVLSVFHIR